MLLDNFEHLLGFAPHLLELLATCSGLQVLVTSRERLNVLGETVLPLSGFETNAAALEFFSFCALRLGVKFDPTDTNAPQICDALERYPLALELAAALTPILPLEEILNALRVHLDALNTNLQPDRHHSMRAVFNWSWSLLTNPQRVALARLAVFKDGFARAAAFAITESNLTMLVALLQKSLVQNQYNGRYRLHPLIAQYCQEALEAVPLEQQKASARHAEFFLDGSRTMPPMFVQIKREVFWGRLKPTWRITKVHGCGCAPTQMQRDLSVCKMWFRCLMPERGLAKAYSFLRRR
ncbi:MAG: hypothetical protein HC781_23055 [Leptolyngbyaceae cyanobacterium CSU_1_4]|nr:hypothetical protein [Leptolyngbyaceae cyanobacterium CSU_1_4]